MAKEDGVYIKQIQDAASKIEDFVSGLTRDDFRSDLKTQSSVIMQLIIIGETSKKISEETKRKIDLPWKDVMGFRDEAVHNYFDVDTHGQARGTGIHYS